MDPSVLVDRREGVVALTLNRPDRLNAFNTDMHARLAEALDAAASDESCRAVLLTGAGRGFCAGQDLSDRMQSDGPVDLGATLEATYNPLVRRIRALAQAGRLRRQRCRRRRRRQYRARLRHRSWRPRSAKFIQAFAKIGLVPDSGGTFFLPRLIGDARARALAMLAEPVAVPSRPRLGV